MNDIATRQSVNERNRARNEAARQALIEDVEWLLATETAERVADRLGTTVGALSRRLYRAGRRDLAAPFSRAADAQRNVA